MDDMDRKEVDQQGLDDPTLDLAVAVPSHRRTFDIRRDLLNTNSRVPLAREGILSGPPCGGGTLHTVSAHEETDLQAENKALRERVAELEKQLKESGLTSASSNLQKKARTEEEPGSGSKATTMACLMSLEESLKQLTLVFVNPKALRSVRDACKGLAKLVKDPSFQNMYNLQHPALVPASLRCLPNAGKLFLHADLLQEKIQRLPAAQQCLPFVLAFLPQGDSLVAKFPRARAAAPMYDSVLPADTTTTGRDRLFEQTRHMYLFMDVRESEDGALIWQSELTSLSRDFLKVTFNKLRCRSSSLSCLEPDGLKLAPGFSAWPASKTMQHFGAVHATVYVVDVEARHVGVLAQGDPDDYTKEREIRLDVERTLPLPFYAPMGMETEPFNPELTLSFFWRSRTDSCPEVRVHLTGFKPVTAEDREGEPPKPDFSMYDDLRPRASDDEGEGEGEREEWYPQIGPSDGELSGDDENAEENEAEEEVEEEEEEEEEEEDEVPVYIHAVSSDEMDGDDKEAAEEEEEEMEICLEDEGVQLLYLSRLLQTIRWQ